MKHNQQLFLDANAHLPLNDKALQAYVNFNRSLGGHGHAQSPSEPGRAAANAIEESRAKIAELIGADSSNQIVFTSTCSQACEWALFLLQQLKPTRAFCSPVEHPAVRYKYRELFAPHYLTISANGVISPTHHFPENSAAICIHVQNEIGVIQPVEKLGADYVVSDMSQGLGKIPIKMSSFPNISISMFGAHKFGGPGGVGFLFLKNTDIWKEFGSGSRYFLDRPGTPDAASIVATAVALEEASKSLAMRYTNMIEFRAVLEPGLEELGCRIISQGAARIPGTTFFRVPNSRSLHLMAQLAESGIYVGLGSACGSLHTGPSPLMTQLGLGGNTHDYIRISQFGEYTASDAKRVLSKMRVFFPKE